MMLSLCLSPITAKSPSFILRLPKLSIRRIVVLRAWCVGSIVKLFCHYGV